jgi:hypothetical protein
MRRWVIHPDYEKQGNPSHRSQLELVKDLKVQLVRPLYFTPRKMTGAYSEKVKVMETVSSIDFIN